MPFFTIAAIDENGKTLAELLSVSSALFPGFDDTRFGLLRFIDPYGDTVLNRMQIPSVLDELELLKETTVGEEKREIIDRIARLASRCEKPHLYLKFIGD